MYKAEILTKQFDQDLSGEARFDPTREHVLV